MSPDRAALRFSDKYLVAKVKIKSLKAFHDIRYEVQQDNVVRYHFIFSIRKIIMSAKVVNVLAKYQNDKKVFSFKACRESEMYKMFLRKWDDRFDKESEESEICEEEPAGERNTGGAAISEMQTGMEDRTIKSYVNLESDFRKIRRSFNIFARKLKRKVGTNSVKKSQTYQYLLHRTIFDVQMVEFS